MERQFSGPGGTRKKKVVALHFDKSHTKNHNVRPPAKALEPVTFSCPAGPKALTAWRPREHNWRAQAERSALWMNKAPETYLQSARGRHLSPSEHLCSVLSYFQLVD